MALLLIKIAHCTKYRFLWGVWTSSRARTIHSILHQGLVQILTDWSLVHENCHLEWIGFRNRTPLSRPIFAPFAPLYSTFRTQDPSHVNFVITLVHLLVRIVRTKLLVSENEWTNLSNLASSTSRPWDQIHRDSKQRKERNTDQI